MRVRIRLAALALAAAAALVAQTAAAQTGGTVQMRQGNAVELDPDDPRARRASELATLLAGSAAPAAEKYLKAHAAPGSAAAADIPKQVKELKAALDDDLVVQRIVEGRDGEVMVSLTSATGERGRRVGVAVQVDASAPHRITAIRIVQPRRVGGGL